MSNEWGLCQNCRWWQIEPDATVSPQTCGMCIEEDLQPYNIRINGAGGCNHFTEGEPQRAEGSAEKPPVAAPQV